MRKLRWIVLKGVRVAPAPEARVEGRAVPRDVPRRRLPVERKLVGSEWGSKRVLVRASQFTFSFLFMFYLFRK